MADKLVKLEGLPDTACQHLWYREGTLQFVTPPSFPASNPPIPRCTKYNTEPPDMAAECVKGEEHCPLAQ